MSLYLTTKNTDGSPHNIILLALLYNSESERIRARDFWSPCCIEQHSVIPTVQFLTKGSSGSSFLDMSGDLSSRVRPPPTPLSIPLYPKLSDPLSLSWFSAFELQSRNSDLYLLISTGALFLPACPHSAARSCRVRGLSCAEIAGGYRG